MNLFDYANLKENSLIDRLELYIEQGNIKKVSFIIDYDDLEVCDIKKKYDWWCDEKRFIGKVYAKGFNYNIWQMAVNSKDLNDFLKNVKRIYPQNVSHFIRLIKSNNIQDLDEFKIKFIREPQRLSFIQAESIEKVKEIAKDCSLLIKQINNFPELKNKRKIRKICGLYGVSKKDENVGEGLESIFAAS